jgi:hypothetical protein
LSVCAQFSLHLENSFPNSSISRAVSLPIFTPRDFMLPRNVSSGFKIPPEKPEYLKDFEWVV